MIVRKKIWPRTLSDMVSMIFVLTIVPLIYWFELWIVLPDIHEIGTLPYYCHFVFGNFLMINIVGNFTYTVLCDTSTRNIAIPSADSPRWRLCPICEALAPPRSWHCASCKTCVLKRDHHCVFTGCCVGHTNHRYFIMFVLNIFIAATYAFYYNTYFVWSRAEFEFPASILKIVFPVAIFVFGFDPSIQQFYLMLWLITGVTMCFTGVLLFYHIDLVVGGYVANEKAKGDRTYDLGWRKNIMLVFGERWRVAWIAPYVTSKLAHDGSEWETRESLKSR